jgi:hypothetical protein
MRAAVVSTLAAAVVLSGCSSRDLPAVAVTAVPTASNDACARLHAALPKDLGEDLPRRDVTPDDPHLAAYGDPPVVVRCGAPATTRYRQGDQLFDVNGVDWFPDERADAVVWSLPRAFVNVEVTVPRAYAGDRLSYLTAAVKAATG